ncbi:MAG: hypothetical protein OXC80_12990 [Gammaproteobacteria bacterium]|nr:hypothetical protein [Gammaproteobacteria bacterium]
MSKSVTYQSTLSYYDGPEVIETNDAFHDPYIGYAITSSTTAYKFLVVRVPTTSLVKLRLGKIDLLTVVKDFSKYGWYLCETDNLDQPITLVEQAGLNIPEALLPNPDTFMIEQDEESDQVLSEALSRNKFVIHLKLEPTNHHLMHQFKLCDYTDVLSKLNSLIVTAGKSGSQKLSHNEKSELDLSIVAPALKGSVEIIVESTNINEDVFEPNGKLVNAMERIDSTISDVHGAYDLQILVERYGVEFAQKYIKLLKVLVRSEADFSCSWAEPNFQKRSGSSLVFKKAKSLIDDMKQHANEVLHEVDLPVKGKFVEFKRKTGTWGLETKEGLVVGVVDKTERPGKLDGLEVGRETTFHCIERRTFNHALTNSKSTLILKYFECV